MAQKIWEIYSQTAGLVKQAHLDAKLFGHHDWVHVFRVGQLAMEIYNHEWKNAGLASYAGVAGLCHSADRVLQAKKESSEEADIRRLLEQWITLTNPQGEDIINAILRHSNVNDDADSRFQIALMDADRCVNMSLDLVIRSGQHFPNLPPVDYVHWTKNPNATYRDPKSVLYDINCALDWIDPQSAVCCRTELGKKIASERALNLRSYIDLMHEQLREDNVFDFPLSD